MIESATPLRKSRWSDGQAIVAADNDQAPPVALRLDDVGAASKRWEVYSKQRLGNWLFLKRVPPFRAWGPYRELEASDWNRLFELLAEYGAKITVAVTAAWVESLDDLIPYPVKFPEASAVLRAGVEAGLAEVANHGLTHCVLVREAIYPGWFHGNRAYHREFWEWVPRATQEEHLRRSQDILQEWLGAEVVTFVPPGNVFGEATLEIAAQNGLRYVSCRTAPRHGADGRPAIVGDENVLPCHDRDLVLYGLDWLRAKLEAQRVRGFCFVRDLGKAIAVDSAQ